MTDILFQDGAPFFSENPGQGEIYIGICPVKCPPAGELSYKNYSVLSLMDVRPAGYFK
jgi:hypothetical protein